MHYNFNSKLGMNILRTKWIKQERDKKKVTPALSADWVHFSLLISKTNTVSWPWCYSFEFISWSYNEQVEPPGTTVPHESTYLTPWPLEEHKTSTISSHFSCSGPTGWSLFSPFLRFLTLSELTLSTISVLGALVSFYLGPHEFPAFLDFFFDVRMLQLFLSWCQNNSITQNPNHR